MLKSLVLFLLFILPLSAKASILVEPLIGHNFGAKFGDLKASGLSYGGKLGFQSEGGFQIGAEYLKSTFKINDDEVFNNDLKMTEMGAFIGYKTDVFKIYVGLVFSAEGETEVVDGQKVTFEEGAGNKIGIGFTGLKYVHVNLEYRQGKFDEIKLSNVPVGSDKYSSLMLSLSIPLTL